MTHRQLILPEEIMLLILNDETGAKMTSWAGYVCAGAAIAELALEGALRMEGEGKKARLAREGALRPDHPYLAAVARLIEDKGLRKPPSDLVGHVGQKREPLRVLLSGLVDSAILEKERRRILGIFPVTRYPLADKGAEMAIRDRLSRVMFDGHEATPRDAALIALADQAGVLRRNFDKAKLKEHKDRIKAVQNGDALGIGATKEAIQAVQAVVIIATTTAVIAGT